MVSDRGPDLTSKDLEDAAFQLGIELDFNPPRTPHFKGTVESFFDGLEMWQESAAQFPPCIPATPDELLVLLSKRADRTLSPRGIELGGMFYASDEVMALRCELASHNVDADRVAVRYNPWDLGEVWVLNSIDNTYLKASAVDPAMKGMTEYQWRVLKRAIRDRFDQPDHLLNLAAGRNAIRDVVEAAIGWLEVSHRPSRLAATAHGRTHRLRQ